MMSESVQYFSPDNLLEPTRSELEYHIDEIKNLIARNMKGDRPTVSVLKSTINLLDRHYRYLDANDMRDDKICYTNVSSPCENMEEVGFE